MEILNFYSIWLSGFGHETNAHHVEAAGQDQQSGMLFILTAAALLTDRVAPQMPPPTTLQIGNTLKVP